jgi:hypothetical protein
VLVTGGTSGPGFNNAATPVYPAEVWDPATETWTTLAASATMPRLYHSAATLLPDGRVLSTGGNGQLTPEAFSPPYLFKGARPTMSAVPTTIGYGQTFSVQTPVAESITKVTLIRITSVTHAFNQNQRLSVLSFTRPGSGTLDIVAPATSNVAPPGHYLLFLVNLNGVPSVGNVVQLVAPAPGGTFQFSDPTYSVGENAGNALVTVTRTGGSSGAVNVSFATSNGTATASGDYTAVSQTVSFANGDTSNKTISIPIINDTTAEANETVNLALSNPTGGAIGSPNPAVLTITDNDAHAPAPLTITTSSLPNARVGAPSSATLAATGGTQPYTWSLAGGTLPDGLLLTNPDPMKPAAVISGMPTSANSTSAPIRFTVKVEAGGAPATKALAIKVNKR